MTNREASRQNLKAANNLARESINMDSLQRIADAVEKMASSYDALRSERDWLKGRRDELRDQVERQARRIRSLKGVITRMKRADVIRRKA